MSRELEGVLIGAGFFAGFQADAWTRIAGARLRAVADTDIDRARTFANQHGIAGVYSDPAEMLAREPADFVDIATRPDSHLALTTLAADRGLAVICQKPLAPTWEESLALVQHCERAKTRLFVHENWRFQPWFREAKRLIEGGAIGRPFSVSFTMRTGDGRGPSPYGTQPYFRDMKQFLIFETVVHFLDTFRYLLGEIREVFCRTARLNPIIAGEDFAQIMVGFENGTHGFVDANRVSGPQPSPVAFGSTVVDGDAGRLRIDTSGRIWLAAAGAPESERPHECDFPETGYKGDAVKATQEHILDALVTNGAAEIEGRAYLATVAAVFACYRSAEEKRLVNVAEITTPKNENRNENRQ